jgi:hypothetical protein
MFVGPKAEENKKRVISVTRDVYDIWYEHRKGKLRAIKSPTLPLALFYTESHLRPIVSVANCYGISQMDLNSAKWICKLYGIPYNPKTLHIDLMKNQKFNLLVGMCELNQHLLNWNGNVDLAILGYKCGDNRVKQLILNGELKGRYEWFYANVFKYHSILEGHSRFKLVPVLNPYNDNGELTIEKYWRPNRKP